MIPKLKGIEKHPPAFVILHYISSSTVNPQALARLPYNNKYFWNFMSA